MPAQSDIKVLLEANPNLWGQWKTLYRTLEEGNNSVIKLQAAAASWVSTSNNSVHFSHLSVALYEPNITRFAILLNKNCTQL